MTQPGYISLRGVEVHNLQGIDLDLPRQKLIVLCGLSGSGKSSLAIDTLYAEGQRRYIESFSAYTRQFLDRLEKPDAERIEGIPPAIAVTARNTSRTSRSTVGTATEATDYLRLLYAKLGSVYCLKCGLPVRRDTAQNTAETLLSLPTGTRYMLAFAPRLDAETDAVAAIAALGEEGFFRVLIDGSTMNLDDAPSRDSAISRLDGKREDGCLYVVLDRLSAGTSAPDRVRDSLETAFSKGEGRCYAFIETSETAQADALGPLANRGRIETIDGRPWRRIGFSTELACEDCGLSYPTPEPRLYSFNSPLGACPKCEGFGNTIDVDLDLVVPDKTKSIRDGAIAPWQTPAYVHEQQELLALADDYDIPVDVPFQQLSQRHLDLIVHGVEERNFGGFDGFFAWLERRKYKMHIRVFLSRWRTYRPCPECGGARLRPKALAARIGGRNIAELHAMKITEAATFLQAIAWNETERKIGQVPLQQVLARLGYLEKVGLGYLTLDRTLRTLSGGEARRVALTSALGSSLVNMLYVLDEPSIGLHPRDIDRLTETILQLRNRANTVVVVEHEEAIIRAADQVVEIGPGAGERGGCVVFQGTPKEMQKAADSLTGDYLAGRRGIGSSGQRREPEHGWIRLSGARGNNLHSVTAEFPLGMLCVVTGVSGSGKSTLVQDTLYPALCRRLRKEAPKPYPFDDVVGDGQLDDVILVDQSPIGRSPRSNPVTYLKIFDEIRAVFAETVEARTRNYTAGHFSFNVEGGRCPHCEGDGFLQIDMQFLPDVYMKCPACRGRRYRHEVLDVTYRGRNIADVLDMTVREAFTFFRGRVKVQARLKRLIDVGLDYIQLGQPANTLSGGEAQRLKLAAYMSSAKRGRCLFLLDEPTTGLHFADIAQLLDCFEALLAVGHSLIVVEHNLQLIKAADHIIDLGPGAADEGGHVVAKGTPEMVARNPKSITGKFLAPILKKDSRAP